MFTIWIYVCQLSIDSIRLYIYGIILCCIAALHCTWSSSAWDPRWLTYLSQTNVLLCGQTMVIYLIVYISHTILLKCCVGVQCALNLWPRELIPSEQFWKSHFFIRSYSSTQLHTVPHRPVMRTSAKDRNFYRGFVAGSYNLVHTNCIHVFTNYIYTQRCAICSLLLVNQ